MPNRAKPVCLSKVSLASSSTSSAYSPLRRSHRGIAMPSRRVFLRSAAGIAAASSRLAAAQAPKWPSQPLKIIIPNAAGGTSDILARLLTQPLAREMAATVVVENRPGGNSNIGPAMVAQASDLHTLLLCDVPTMIINSIMHKDIQYNYEKDLKTAAIVGVNSMLYAVNPELDIHRIQDLAPFSKRRRLNVAMPAMGTPQHLGTIELAKKLGISCQFVPYKGGAQAMQDTASGASDMVVSSVLSMMSLVQAGRLRAIGVAADKRPLQLSNVPTMAEQGIPGFVVTSTQGVSMPSRSPSAHIEQVNAAVRKCLQLPEVVTRLTEMGSEAPPMSVLEIADFARAEQLRWSGLVAQAGGQLDTIN
jgi:tripartite-type tricarboxylate transporter receptor subunit TctC